MGLSGKCSYFLFLACFEMGLQSECEGGNRGDKGAIFCKSSSLKCKGGINWKIKLLEVGEDHIS